MPPSSFWMTALTVLLGMAKPTPLSLPWPVLVLEPETICELMPMTSPAESSSGPPELPGLSAASVWITPLMVAPSGALICRFSGGDDAGGQRPVQPEWVPDRVCRVADLRLAGVGEDERVQFEPARIDLQHGEVGRARRCRRRVALRVVALPPSNETVISLAPLTT